MGENELGEVEGGEGQDERVPCTHETRFESHGKLVTCVALDKAGARVATAGNDYKVRLHDFAGMDKRMRPFRELEPFGAHAMMSLRFNASGEGFLAVPNAAQPKVFDRDGREQGQFPAGDMYLRDMKNTKGHIMGCTGGAFHPAERSTCITSSEDGTLRVWDVTRLGDPSGPQKAVIKPLLKRPGRFSVTACDISPNGDLIAGAVSDGSIQMFPTKGQSYRSAAIGQVLPPKAQMVRQNSWTTSGKPEKVARGCHEDDVSCVKFSPDGTAIVSRAHDGTIKLWDLRSLPSSKPVAIAGEMDCSHAATDATFSPCGSKVLVCVNAEKQASGRLDFLRSSDLKLVSSLEFPHGILSAEWHRGIGQIVVSGGNRHEGFASVLYDPSVSVKGALLCAQREERNAKRAMEAADVNLNNAARTPHAIRELGDPNARANPAKRSLKARESPSASMRPQPPSKGRGQGGQIGATTQTLLTQEVVTKWGNAQAHKLAEQDPREHLLRHANKAARFTSAYSGSDPQHLLDKDTNEDPSGAPGQGSSQKDG